MDNFREKIIKKLLTVKTVSGIAVNQTITPITYKGRSAFT